MSGCEGGVVKVWDIDTGYQVLKFSECHGKHELTAMALDSTGRRLITGSRAGEIKVCATYLCFIYLPITLNNPACVLFCVVKVWNYMNSECVKLIRSPSYCEVTGVMHLLN